MLPAVLTERWAGTRPFCCHNLGLAIEHALIFTGLNPSDQFGRTHYRPGVRAERDGFELPYPVQRVVQLVGLPGLLYEGIDIHVLAALERQARPRHHHPHRRVHILASEHTHSVCRE
jgi:hypothetical protein